MIKLLKGNCLDLLRQLEPGCADLVLIDLPYSSGGLFAGDQYFETATKRIQEAEEELLNDF